jgi:bacterioferritin
VRGNPQVIAELNKLLKNELTAINQYFLHARMERNWGFERLGKKVYEESIDEMKHADRLIKRILFLEGLPNLQDLGRLRIGEAVPECLRADLELETEARTALVAAVALFESTQYYVSRELAEDILEDAEEHIDFLETEIALIDKVGLQNYLQSQMGEGKDPS